jgi:hypothetical protein
METLELGSVSSGTMLEEDLIPSFMAILGGVDPKRAKSYHWANRKYFNYLDGKRTNHSTLELDDIVNCLSEIVDELMNMLYDYCPSYTYFGTHPGDAADYGVWVDDDSIREDIREGTLHEVSDLSELDTMLVEDGKLPKSVIVTNDHGNQTLCDIEAKFTEDDFSYGFTWKTSIVWDIV